ncbi:REP-associated tyrosine transposase [Neobacillus jeddahensis]|uniref:REP-associated tyrosine transposase n=1 Tax=Neobacillus jeddahensis TaxID=1461580 RepID=UPI00058DFBF0|nr:transposase [Neobacillus jeddahensis]
MSRKLRVWFPGAIYHITSRGNRRSVIFFDDFDRVVYLELLEETRQAYPFHLLAYCLMDNHVHLQIETIDDHPKDIMKMINSRYAIYLNKRYEQVGHVFQGRYGSEMIVSTDYLLDVNRYIHLNPVEAQMVRSPQDYPWSSYLAYLSDTYVSPIPIQTTKVLTLFPKPQIENYCKFVEDIPVPDPHNINAVKH